MPLTAHSEGLMWTRQQVATLIVVVALHIWLLWVPWTKHPSQLATPMETILLLLPLESNEPLSKGKPKHTAAPTSRHISSTGDQAAPVDQAIHLPAAEIPHIEAANQVDWYAAGVATAQQAAKTATIRSTVREFGQSIHHQAPATIKPPSVFHQPAHRFGDITRTPEGDDIVWLSENCYQIANSSADDFQSLVTGVPNFDKSTVRCKQTFGKHHGNAHLFDFLKHPSTSKHPEQVWH